MAFNKGESGAEFTGSKDVPRVKGMKVASSDESSGTIVATTGVSLRSWGEKIPIVVTESEPGKSMVSVASKSKMALVDWGKNKQNVERILEATDEVLGS
jgi:hypothetical protein